ncbi:MAG TPA: SusC/RagA family TonB-linked outer membrane protein [Puia sp.]|nr:SusC/RagA family TonB-linked outer membrane protein [Puia sp.]
MNQLHENRPLKKRKWLIGRALPLLLLWIIAGVSPSMAQTQKISGKIKDESGAPVVRATVRDKDSRRGTVTDAEGKFSLTVKPGAVLLISAIGYETTEMKSGESATIEVALKIKNSTLNEVVVTALGIKREKSQLTYSTQQVKGDDLTATKEPGILNALAGKVSGVQITASSGAPGASSRIVIRGNSSLLGNNEALIVLDGVPINNDQTGNAAGVATNSAVGGTSRLSDIDPSTIESINVLKGSAASALYGSNAARGVVVITTKGGAYNSRPKVTLNSQYSFENPIFPQIQGKYAQGDRGKYINGEANKSSTVWGPTVDSLRSVGLLTYYKNPMKAFFTTGRTFTNSLSVGGGNEKSNYFFSFSNVDQKGTIPTTNYKRNALFAKFTNKLTDKISTTFQLGYTLGTNHSVPEGYDLTDPLWTVYTSPWTWNPLPYLDSVGNQRVFRFSRNNPYWDLYNVYNNDKISRVIPVLTVTYKPTTWLSFTERVGADTYSEQTDYFEAPSNTLGTVGTITQQSSNYRQINHDLIGEAHKRFGDFDVSLLVGNNIKASYSQTHTLIGTGTSIAGFDNISNGATINGSEKYFRERKVGFYAQSNIGYKGFLNLSLTGRYDGSSVLNQQKNFYPYGSASAGFLFSQLLKVPAISFGKLRVSYSSVGNDNIPAYSLTTPYTSATSFPYGGNAGFLQSQTLGNPTLVNEVTKESEVGLEMNFLKNRIGFEVSYFDRHHDNLLTSNVPIAPSTGYSSTSLNAAFMTNKGFEALVNLSPFRGEKFGWDITLNYSRIRNKVTKVNGNTNSIQIGQTWAFVGKPYGEFYTQGYSRDTKGNILIDDNGLPITASANQMVGNIQPDFLAGMNNSFYFGSFTFSFFFDFRKGGDILNSDDRYGWFYGTPKITENRQDRVIKGIVASTGKENTKSVHAEDYFQRLNTNYEAAIQDGTYLKLRNASIGYKLPASLIGSTPFSAASLTLTGRNLWIHAPHFTGSDPEVSSYGTGNGSQGVYGNTVPTSRSFNLTLNVVFK